MLATASHTVNKVQAGVSTRP